MRFLANLLDLLVSLPWWGSLAVIVGLIAFVLYARWWFRNRIETIIHEGVLEAGSALKDAQATVHSVTAAPAPNTSSPYDIKEGDEAFCEGVDDQPWDDEEANYYSIDVTITPAEPTVGWDPTALAMVPADFTPDDPTDLCEQLCGLHSAERFVNGRWEPMPETEVRGPLRLRLLMGIPDGLRSVKFANFVTYFGHVDLPTPLPKPPKATTRR
jgi:hypothetical protein